MCNAEKLTRPWHLLGTTLALRPKVESCDFYDHCKGEGSAVGNA